MHATIATEVAGSSFLIETRNYDRRYRLRKITDREGFVPRSGLWELMA